MRIEYEYEQQLEDRLCEVFANLKTKEEVKEFLVDLCTNKEIEQMAQRVKAAELLLEGNTYTAVTEQLDISSATLARVSRAVQYGKGYKRLKT